MVHGKKSIQRRRRKSESFAQVVRQFLTPEVFKQAHRARRAKRRSPRWDVQPLLFVLLLTTFCTGDSSAERFEAARAFYVACHETKKRPGRTLQGFQAALSKLPVGVLRGVAASIRRQLLVQLDDRLRTGPWMVFGCDGSRVECPRSEELEERLGKAGKEQSAPSAWITAFVHLQTGLLWAWRVGLGTASEQQHLLQMLDTLPGCALVVTDAAYRGYELALEMMGRGLSFLVRVGSQTWLYTEDQQPLEQFQEGIVLYWPKARQHQQLPPLRLRLIRIRDRQHKHDVWLLTNVLDAHRLDVAMAGQFYRWRWGNEGLFRTYKRTLHKVKLMSRSVRLVHRELEGSLMALQLMLAQAALRLHPCSSLWNPPNLASPRKVLVEIRREIAAATPSRRRAFSHRIAQATLERRVRTSGKQKREWPRRKPHKPPAAPRIISLSSEQKALLNNLETAA